MHGPLSGLEGVLLRRKGAFRLILSIDLIMKSIVVDVDVAESVHWKLVPGGRVKKLPARTLRGSPDDELV